MTTSAEGTAAGSAGAGRVPDFFIVGHNKSGTTALYEMLRRHPQIYMSAVKEPMFFDRELHPTLERSKSHPDTLAGYLALFEGAQEGQRAGEASPGYLRSQAAAARIAELEPDARIIAIFREPASFLRSMHLELLKDHVEKETDLRRAIEREERTREQKPTLWYSADRVQYVEQLRRYHAVFPREHVLVLIYDDFRADNEGTVSRVLQFLGVEDALPAGVADANRTVRVRSPRLYDAVRSVYLGRGPVAGAAKSGIKALTPRRLRHEGLATVRRRVLYGKPRPADDELMLELRRRFKGEVVALSEYLDRDLVSLWGYDEIG
jgi:hypothetical protein